MSFLIWNMAYLIYNDLLDLEHHPLDIEWDLLSVYHLLDMEYDVLDIEYDLWFVYSTLPTDRTPVF